MLGLWARRVWVGWSLLFLFLVALDLRRGLIGAGLAPVFGAPDQSGWVARLAAALCVVVALRLNFYFLSFLRLSRQVVVVWVELLFLIGVFFYSFNLSYEFILGKLPFLVFQGVFTTLYISLLSIFFACVVALLAALAKLSRNGVLRGSALLYVSFFRGTPLLVQCFIIYLGLPQLGLVLAAVPSGILALTLCYGAYMAEIFRSGIQNVPAGQREAALALGLGRGLIFTRIIFPQAMRLIVPPTGNQFIAMLKDSSLVSVMGVWELMFLARTLGRSEFRHFEMLLTAAVLYWLLSMVFELAQARLERHYNRGH